MKTNVHDQPSPLGNAVGLTLAVAFIVGSVLLGGLGLIPPEAFERVALRFSGDGALEAFSEWFAGVSRRALWAALFFGPVGLLLLITRRTVGPRLVNALGGIRRFSGALTSRAFRSLVDHPIQGITLMGLTAFGLVLRFQGLDLPATTDEAQTVVRYASRSSLWIMAMHPTNNNHVPYSLLVHGVGSIFGYSPFFIRLPALAAGLAIIPLTFGLARLCVGRQAALIASAIVAVSYRLVEYSAQARGYTFVIVLLLLGGLCVAQLIRMEDSDDSERETPILLIGVFCSLALWTIVSALYGVVAIFLWWSCSIIRRRCWHEIKEVFVAGILVCVLSTLLYLPILLTGGLEALLPKSIYSDYTRWESLIYLITEFPIGLSQYFFPGLSLIVVIAGGVLLCFGIWTQMKTSREIRLSPALFALITIVVMLPLQAYGPSLSRVYRTFIWLLPFFSIAMGAGAWRLLQFIPQTSLREWSGSALAIVIAVILTTATPFKALEQDRIDFSGLSDPTGALALVHENLQPGDGLISPNRIYWNLQYQFLLHELSRRPFQQGDSNRSAQATRILLVGHNTMQDEAELVEEIRARRGILLERPLQALGTRGNMTLYVTEAF